MQAAVAVGSDTVGVAAYDGRRGFSRSVQGACGPEDFGTFEVRGWEEKLVNLSINSGEYRRQGRGCLLTKYGDEI